MTTDERIDRLETRVDKIEDRFHNKELSNLEKYNELEKLITKAVSEGNKEIYTKLENMETRIIKLENQDGEKAKLILKSVGATTLGWLVLGILNNAITMFNK